MAVIVCENCGKKYSSEVLFQYHHIVEHTSESIPCGHCSKRFPNADTMSRHLSAHNRIIHSCNLCGALCKSQLLLYVHLTSVHQYGGALVCHLCQKRLTKRGLGDHYVKIHSGSVERLEQQAEMFCSVHSSRPFPEESWTLDYVLNCRSEAAAATEPADVSSKPSKGLSKKKAAALEDHVAVAPELPHGNSGEETVCTTDDSGILQLLRKLYALDPVYALKHLDHSQSSTSIYRGLSLDGRKQLDALLDPENQKDLNQKDLNQSSTSNFRRSGLDDWKSLSWYNTIHSHGSDLSEGKNTKPIVFYLVLPPCDGKQELMCILCGLRYEDLASLLADHKPVDIKLTSG